MARNLQETLPQLSHGDHCCLFFNSPDEQTCVTIPFLQLGLRLDERCVFVGDQPSVERIREGLKESGVNVDQESRKNRLVLTSEQKFLDGGHWRTEKMLGFLQNTYDAAMSDGFTALRAAGDVSWQVGPDRDYKEVVYYEALLDLFFVGKRMVGMCQYPKDKCPADTLGGILNTHKIAAIDSTICSNFHYMPPQLFLEKDAAARQKKRVDWMTSQLLRVQKAEAERDRLQEQLLQSQKMESIGRLAGGVAHDFNNILTAILGFADFIIGNKSLDSNVRSDAREIQKASERASALTRQLLSFSRRQVMQPRVININETVQSMEKFLGRIIPENIEIKTFLSSSLSNVRADPGLIEQVIMNLAVNARDAMPEGGKLTLETSDVELSEDYAQDHPEISAGPHVMLAVSDTGCGMDSATISRIFEPFFTTKEKGKGTGLGLSMVYGVVRQSGGSIYVYSEPAKGAVFKIYFPPVPEKISEARESRQEAGDFRGTETVLIVDDDDQIRKLMNRVLVEYGYTVLEAISAQEALKFCERHDGRIDMMITDAVLPQISGHELAKQSAPLRPKMKIVFMSGYANDAAVHHGILEEGRAFIEKPFAPQTILRKVREVLDGQA